jgi:hypothetical protein
MSRLDISRAPTAVPTLPTRFVSSNNTRDGLPGSATRAANHSMSRSPRRTSHDKGNPVLSGRACIRQPGRPSGRGLRRARTPTSRPPPAAQRQQGTSNDSSARAGRWDWRKPTWAARSACNGERTDCAASLGARDDHRIDEKTTRCSAGTESSTFGSRSRGMPTSTQIRRKRSARRHRASTQVLGSRSSKPEGTTQTRARTRDSIVGSAATPPSTGVHLAAPRRLSERWVALAAPSSDASTYSTCDSPRLAHDRLMIAPQVHVSGIPD